MGKFNRRFVIGAIAALFVLATGGGAAQAQEFVSVRGGQLVHHGKTLALRGATMYPYWTDNGKLYRSEGWSMPGFTRYIDQILDLDRSAGMNTIRPTDELLGAKDVYDPVVWSNLDYLVNAAAKRHMYVILDLSEFRNFEQSRKLPGYDIPAWSKFIEFIVPRYRKFTNVVGYSIAGEVEAPNSNLPTRLTAEGYIQFFSATEGLIHSLDPDHLIYAGGLTQLDWNGGVPWQEIFDLPYNGICAIHTYSPGDRGKTIPMVSGWAKSHGKPFLIEEFGFEQKMGDAERADAFQNVYSLADRAGAGGVVFWNLGVEDKPGSYDVGPQTPLTWKIVHQNAVAAP